MVILRNVSLIILLILTTQCQKEGGKVNHPPRIDRVGVSPEIIHVDDQIILSPLVSDPEGDDVKIDYRWYLNGKILTRAMSSTLDVEISKGDRIEVELIPNDGKTNGKPYRLGPFVVENSPPRISKYALIPLQPRTDTSLTLTVQTEDVDGDKTEIGVDWEINGEIIERFRNRYQLDPGDFKRGDMISCIITATDGEDSAQTRSIPLKVSNGAPRFIGFSSRYENGMVLLSINGEDPDGDPLTISVKSGPTGIKIDQKMLQLSWTLSGAPGTSYTDTLNLQLSDPYGGRSEAKIPVTVNF